MRKFWLRLAWGIGLLLFILLAAVAIFGGDLARRLIEYGASRYLADQLQIEHGLSWQLWPHPELRIRGLHVQDASGQSKARVGSLELSLYGRKSLLQGQWALRRLDIADVELYLKPERLQAKAWLRAPAAAPTPATTPPALPAVDHLALHNIKLHYQHQTQDNWLLQIEHAQLQAQALTARFQLQRKQQQATLALNGELASTLDAQTATAPPHVKQLQLQLRGHLADWQLASHLALAQPTAASTATLVFATSLQRAQQQLAFAMQAKRQADNSAALNMVASAHNDQAAQLIARLDADIDALATKTAFAIRDAQLLGLHPATARVHHLALTKASGTLDLTRQQAQLRLDGRLDEQPLHARLDANADNTPPFALQARLAQLNLDHYLPASTAPATPDKTLPATDFWQQWPLTLDLSVKTLRFNNIISHNARLRLYNQD